MKFLNDMLDFFLVVDNSFKPTLNQDTEQEIKKYKVIESGLQEKIDRIKKAFIDGLLEPTILATELKEIEIELEMVQNKIKELENLKESMEYKQDIETIFNLKEIEKMKAKGEYVKTNNLWKKLSQEQKQFLINKYIDEIEISVNKDYNVTITNIIFNKNEIENIGYMFRNDCFDMIVNVNERDIILSNYKKEQEKNDYVATLRNFYNIKETTISADTFDINNFSEDDIIQIIPQEKSSKFDKNKFTILQIEV